MPTYRSFDNKNALPADKYGDIYQFADGTHGTMTHISSVLKNGKQYIVKGSHHQRGSFMWLDQEGIIHIVVGRKSRKSKKQLVNNEEKKAICQVSWEEDREISGKWEDAWECYWHTWDRYPEAYIKFLQFTTKCNFLE